jgi:hypothetical protein
LLTPINSSQSGVTAKNHEVKVALLARGPKEGRKEDPCNNPTKTMLRARHSLGLRCATKLPKNPIPNAKIDTKA